MDFGLTGRTALVLASTGGLGAATARALAAEGANIVVTGRTGTAAVAAELRTATGAQAIGVDCDLTDPVVPQQLVTATREVFGDPDIVVLNGPGPTPGAAADLTVTGARDAIDLMLTPHVAVVSAVLPPMRAAGWGRILALGSSGVQQPIPMLSASNLGRAALAGYLKTLAAEVAPDGVTVNMLLPGRIATARVAAIDEATARRTGRTVEQVRTESLANTPAGRYGRPDEFGAVAAFLCSTLASYVTGSQIRCDGGMIAHL